MTGPEHSTSLSRAYRERRDAMQAHFPEAVSFLRGLEVLCDGDHGFHMGTALNVQFYLQDAFLFYLQLLSPRSARPALMLSPYPHGQLRDGTRDVAHVVFSRRIRQVIETLSLPPSSVIRRQRGYLISPGTPAAFFDLLVAQLLDVVRCGDASPLQRDLFTPGDRDKPRRRRKRRTRRTPQADRQRPTAEQRLVSLAREIDDAIGLLAAELQDRLGEGVTLDVRAGRARLESLAADPSGAPSPGPIDLQAETVSALVDQLLSAPPAPAPGDEDALEELGSLVVEPTTVA